MGDLIVRTTYDSIMTLPEVRDAHSLDLNRELGLLRSIVAAGLSQRDDRTIAKALETIASFLKKEQALSKVQLISKDDIHMIVDQLIERVQCELPNTDLKELESILHGIVRDETNHANET